MRNNEEYISVKVALGPGSFDPGWAAGAFTGYISCAISQFLCFSHFCPIKIGVDFFRLKLVNHLFEADLCCKLSACLSGLSFHELLWSLSYFSHPGSVPCASHGSLGIACLSLLQLLGIVPESGRVLQDFAGEVSPEAFNSKWGFGFLLCHVIRARTTLYKVTWDWKEGNEGLTAPNPQLNICTGSLDVSAVSFWISRGIIILCIGAGRVEAQCLDGCTCGICTWWGLCPWSKAGSCHHYCNLSPCHKIARAGAVGFPELILAHGNHCLPLIVG